MLRTKRTLDQINELNADIARERLWAEEALIFPDGNTVEKQRIPIVDEKLCVRGLAIVACEDHKLFVGEV